MAFRGYNHCEPPSGGESLMAAGDFDAPMNFRLSYVGIQVRELSRSLRFYQENFGMQLVRRERVAETGGEWAELRSPGSDWILELNWYPEGSAFFRGPYRNGDELDHIAFECADVAKAYRELIARGVPSGHEPFVEGGTLLAFVQDPDGIWIELTGPATPRSDP
jgi:lactoylglutathione lyase